MTSSDAEAHQSKFPDDAKLREILDKADLNVLRLALYQETGDPALAAMRLVTEPIWGGSYNASSLAPEHHQEVKDKAFAFLKRRPVRSSVPTPAEARKLIEIFTGEAVSDSQASWGYEELAFEDFPRGVEWEKRPDPQTLRAFSVLVVGAGLSGLSVAMRLQRLGIPFSIVERQPDIGGTWALNRYPGARVDIPSANYQFKFEKNYPWQSVYASQQENQEYIRFCATKHGLYERIAFGTELHAATWDEAQKKWRVTLIDADGNQTDAWHNVIVSGSGLFSKPKLPNIPGIERFEGDIVATTAWDADRGLRGKRVALIGNGSSGVQTMPHLARDADRLAVFQRTPQWIMGVGNYFDAVAEETHWLCTHMTNYWNWYVYGGHYPTIHLRGLFEHDRDWQAAGGQISERNDRLRDAIKQYIGEQLADRPDLIAKSTPDYAPWGRRMVIDSGWYQALKRPNVDLVTEPIETFTATGIRTRDGIEREIDTVVLATGFETSRYLWPVTYRGRNGVTLEDLWGKDGPRSYLALVTPGLPNFFMLYGAPNSQPIGGTMASWIEIWSRYIVKTVALMIEGGIHSVECRADVFDTYNCELDRAMEGLIFDQEGQGSYFINEFGRTGTQVPWDIDAYYAKIREPDLSEYTVD